MKSLALSWFASVMALMTLLLLPNVSATSLWIILIPATLIWLTQIVFRPFLQLVLLPFNLATFGLAGAIVSYLLFWLCLWIIPVITIQPARILGFYLGDIAIVAAAAFLLSLVQRSYSWLLGSIFSGKRRK